MGYSAPSAFSASCWCQDKARGLESSQIVHVQDARPLSPSVGLCTCTGPRNGAKGKLLYTASIVDNSFQNQCFSYQARGLGLAESKPEAETSCWMYPVPCRRCLARHAFIAYIVKPIQSRVSAGAFARRKQGRWCYFTPRS